jgi:Tfp pilus assembly protein FimT
MINNKSSMNSSSGVTLIEVLVVTAIMFILLGISFVGYRERGKELELQRAAFKVMADIERVRGMAMSAQEEEISGKIPEGGWGIYFDTGNPRQYILFADLDANKLRKPDASEDPHHPMFIYREEHPLTRLVLSSP